MVDDETLQRRKQLITEALGWQENVYTISALGRKGLDVLLYDIMDEVGSNE